MLYVYICQYACAIVDYPQCAYVHAARCDHTWRLIYYIVKAKIPICGRLQIKHCGLTLAPVCSNHMGETQSFFIAYTGGMC